MSRSRGYSIQAGGRAIRRTRKLEQTGESPIRARKLFDIDSDDYAEETDRNRKPTKDEVDAHNQYKKDFKGSVKNMLKKSSGGKVKAHKRSVKGKGNSNVRTHSRKKKK